MGLLKRASINGTSPPILAFDAWVTEFGLYVLNIYFLFGIMRSIGLPSYDIELKWLLQIDPPSQPLQHFAPQLSGNLGGVAMAVPALKFEMQGSEKVITNPLKMKISESGWHTFMCDILLIYVMYPDLLGRWTVLINNKVTAQKIFDALKSYVEENMAYTMQSDEPWSA